MAIDDYETAIALSDQLEAAIPFKVRLGKEFLKLLREKGMPVSPEAELEVKQVKYSGDAGGIMCAIGESDEEVHIASLTHLKIDPTHALAGEVKAYQQKRIRRLKLQDQRSFLTEVRSLERSQKPQQKKRGGSWSWRK
jgi:hypothetical protein